MKWLFKSKKLFTLDIGSHTLKLAEFLVDNERPFLENFAFLSIPENCIEQGDLINAEPFRDILPEFMSQNIEKSSELYISMGGRSIIVKKMEILRVEKELMDSLVQEEVSQSLPFNVEEINYDYTQIKDPKPYNKGKMNILLVAAKKDIVGHINQLVEDAGYQCASIDMGAFALSSCIKFVYPEYRKNKENILVLDIGKSGTMFIVLHKGDVIFSRYITIGSDFYNVSLMKEMGIALQEAEALKASWCSGDEVPSEVSRIITEGDEYFCDDLFVGCEYFKNQFPDEMFSKIYVTGGGSYISNLVEAISKKFEVPAELLDPFERLKSNDLLRNSLSHIRHFVPVSLGLCLRGINK